MSYTLRDLQSLTGGEVVGDADVVITGVNELSKARAGDLAFAEQRSYLPQVRQTKASAIVVSKQFPEVAGKTLLRVAHPRLAFVRVMERFAIRAPAFEGIHSSAVISPTAQLDTDVSIGECAVIRPHVRIGKRTVIESGVHVGAGVVIGEDCVIGPNVVLVAGTRIGHRVVINGGAVLGGEGFGYVWSEGRHVKVPQMGHVIVEDDVEIGSNVCVDRATMGFTIIGRGTKIDNLVQIAHNDVIGEHVIMSGQVGLSGSVTVGHRVILGGKAGVSDHVTIGDDARVGGATTAFQSVKAGETVWGFSARPIGSAIREIMSLTHLPKLLQQHRKLERRLAAIESQMAPPRRRRTNPRKRSA